MAIHLQKKRMEKGYRFIVHQLPLLSLLLTVMPEPVRETQGSRFDKVAGNLEFAVWIRKISWPPVRKRLLEMGFTWWAEAGERSLWCYGAGRVREGEFAVVWSLLWDSIECGQKARLLLHRKHSAHQLMVISKRDFPQ